MVAPVNDFDIRLQAESPRTLAPRGGIILSATANVVMVSGSTGTPSTITLVATPLVLTGSVVFTTSPSVPLTIDSSGLIATLTYANMGSSSVVVTVTLTSNGVAYKDSRTISQVTIGSLGYTGALNATANNSAQGLLSARPAGANGDIYFATDNLKLYQNIGGSWVEAGNNFTNTNQLTDGANLGGTAAWGGVTGAGKPQDNATVGANASNFAATLGGDNLVNNSSFEIQSISGNTPNGYRAYNNANVGVTFLNAAGRTGGKCFALQANAATTSTFGLQTSTPYADNGVTGGIQGNWQPNKTYVISFKALKVNGAGWTNCILQWNTAPAAVTWVSNPNITTGWQTYTVRITWGSAVEANGQLLIDRNGNTVANDEFHIDELIVQEGDVYSEWFLSSREAATQATGLTISSSGALSGPTGSQGQVTLPGMGHNSFRIISNGSSVTAANMPGPAGFYVNGVSSASITLGRSYVVVVLNRSTGAIISSTVYDVYGGTGVSAMASALNALTSDKLVVVMSYDEPQNNRLTSGLDTAMYRCGASRSVFGSANFMYRSAYVLIGIPGIGEGGGAEGYQGAVASDTNAWVDMGFSLLNGALVGVSNNYTPKTLSDYGYVGDLNATNGATLGTNVNGQITSANSSTLVGSKAINSVHISDLRTTNYAEDGSGNPTSGAKMASGGTAFKVAANSMQVGTLVLSDYWFRLIQGVDGNVANNRIIWRGNNDATTRGGAPNIACLSVTPMASVVSGTTSAGTQTLYHSYKITPTSYSTNTDNLDAIQQIHVQLFMSTTSTAPFTEFYQPCPSRTYDGSAGIVQGNWTWGWYYNSGASGSDIPTDRQLQNTYTLAGTPNYTFSGCMRISIANTYGWSATQDFGPATQNFMACPTTTITGVAGSSGGGSGSQGGACPAPWVKVRLINGKEVDAGDLHNGARLAAVNDSTMQAIPQGGVVRDLMTIWAQRYRVKLTDGTATEWSENHRFAVAERGWVNVQHLRAGDQILGLKESIVESVFAVGEGQVTSFRVEGAGTYFAGGLLCHNTKTY